MFIETVAAALQVWRKPLEAQLGKDQDTLTLVEKIHFLVEEVRELGAHPREPLKLHAFLSASPEEYAVGKTLIHADNIEQAAEM